MKRYGLIGKNISYSLSPKLHNLIADYSGHEISYDIIDIKENEIDSYLNKLKEGIYSGFNVTIPYKETIVKYLDEITFKAKNIGSVNTVYINGEGNLVGDNTDYDGFRQQLINNDILDSSLNNIYILGTGGAAKTVFYVLKEKGYSPINVSRNKNIKSVFDEVISYEDFKVIKEVDLLINCTPVGTYPSNASPIKNIGQTFKVIIDLIYNPLETKLMTFGKKSINGLDMLIYQAINAQKIFNKESIVKEDKKTIKKIKEALIDELIW